MGTYEVNKLILETRLVQLKKDADWWTVGGIYIIIISSFTFGFWFFYTVYPIMILFSGILVLLKGVLLMKSWMKINGEYKKILRADMNSTDHWTPRY